MKQKSRADYPIRQCCLFAACLLVLALFPVSSAFADEKTDSVSFVGPCYFRLPGFRNFVLQQDFVGVPLETLVAVRPDVQHPLATDSKMLVGSYTVIMLPGASIKLSSRGLIPLAGRFIISGEGKEPLVFAGRAFELYYRSGRLLIEVTPDDGTFIALRNKGDAFVKSLNRSVYDLEAGQEVHFPLFGQAKLKKRMSGFWNDPPTGFSAARRRPDSTSMSEKDADDDEEDDSSEDNESDEDTGDVEISDEQPADAKIDDASATTSIP